MDPSVEELERELAIWEQTLVTLTDIRYHQVHPGQEIGEYVAPCSLFLYTFGGSGQVRLDDAQYRTEGFGLFHGGKGTRLSVFPADTAMEYCLLLYKAELFQALAEQLHVSDSYLYRSFKQITGQSPQEYLIHRRLAEAQYHLMDSQAALREIALACGFSDEYSLIRLFKSLFGITPGEFRMKRSMNQTDHAIGWASSSPYTDKRIVNRFEFQDKGDYGFMRGKSKANMSA